MLPPELVEVFFEVIDRDEFCLFNKLAVLSRETARLARLHRKRFEDRVTSDGLLPNGVKHGALEVHEDDDRQYYKYRIEKTRWEFGRKLARMTEEYVYYIEVSNFERELIVWNFDAEEIYRLSSFQMYIGLSVDCIETIGQKQRTMELEDDLIDWKFDQPLEVMVKPVE